MKHLTLYTQPNCTFCDILKSKLVEYGFTFWTLDITESPTAMDFMRQVGAKTVPQLYCGSTKINNIDTEDITKEYLLMEINKADEYSERPECDFRGI